MAYLGKTPSQAVRSRYYFTATGGETSLSGADDNSNTLTFTDGNYVDVALNGVALVAGTDYNTTTANTIGGLAALTASDVVEVVVYDTFSIFGGNVKGDFTITNGTLSAEDVTVTGLTTTGNINFGDNDKAQFGAGNDLQIYHDGSNSFISDEGTGSLAIRTNGVNVNIQKTPYEPMGVFTPDGSVDLYYDNVKKFGTTSAGIDVTGTVTADGLTVDGDAQVSDSVVLFDMMQTDATDWNTRFQVNGSAFDIRTLVDNKSSATNRLRIDNSSGDISFYADNGTTQGLFWDASTQRLGLGTTSPDADLSLTSPIYTSGGADNGIRFQNQNNNGDAIVQSYYSGTTPSALLHGANIYLSTGAAFTPFDNTKANSYILQNTNGNIEFATASSGTASERMRIDNNGNLLVGKTASDNSTVGTRFQSDGFASLVRDGDASLLLRRNTSDGTILRFNKDGTDVGSIGSTTNSYNYFAGPNTGIFCYNAGVGPTSGGGTLSDNAKDLGAIANRWDDVYATNGTIQTSDQNEKQQIASLTSTEITAAKAISKLFKTFKWNSSVTENGANARTHTGVIAQQVETAMTDAGLDAGDYAFFISSDWYVDADGNEVEADAVGAIAKNRKGIRYPELLSFIGAATEQRLADIETRLTALENA